MSPFCTRVIKSSSIVPGEKVLASLPPSRSLAVSLSYLILTGLAPSPLSSSLFYSICVCLRLRRRPSTPAKTLVNLEQCFKKISSWGRRDPAAASATLTPADPRSAPARRTTTRYEFEFRHTSNCHNECFYFFIVFLPQLFPGHPSLHRADAGGAGGGQDAPHQPVHVKLGRGDVFGAHG